MKKWIIRISATLSGLLLLLFLGGFYLLGTESGARFLVVQAEKQLDGQLHIGSSKGKVLDRLELTDILFDSPAGKAELGRLVLDWKTKDLLRLHLHVLEFTADDISYSVLFKPPEPEPEASGPLTLPDLTLPITITIEKLGIHNLVFISAPDAEPLTVDNATVALRWDESGIQLEELGVAMPEVILQAQGQVNPVGHYPLQLKTSVETVSSDLPALKLLGVYRGDLQELVVQEQISGDISAELSLTVQHVIDALAWQGELEIEELRPAAFSPEVPGVLKGKIQTNGNLQQAAVTAALSMRDDTAAEVNWDADLDVGANLETLMVTVNQLSLQHADTPALIELAGTADGDQNLDLTLHWQGLQWPLGEEAEYRSTQGEVTLKGSVDDYHLALHAEMTGRQIPAATLQLTADGNMESAENLQLTVNLLEGVVGVQGKVQWAPAVEWQLSTDGKHINPGVQYDQWPGKLDWLIQTEGSIADAGVVANVTLDRMEGWLRELPVTGNGKIQITPDDIAINDLHFSSGSAVFTAQGRLGHSSELNWKVDVADFSDLLPQAGGQLYGSGAVQGEMSEPQVTLQLSGSSLVFSQLNLEQIQGDAELDLSWTDPFSLNLSGSNLKSGTNLIKQFAVQGNGTMEEHAVQLLASHDMADITFGLKGGYLQEQWKGVLDQFNIASPDLGTWQLVEPAKISAGVTAANMEKMCLGREESSLCVNGSWDVENTNTNGEVQINGFALAWLSPWFPDTLENLDGLFSAKATATMQEKLKAEVSAEITPGTISYITDSNKGSLAHEGMKADIHVVGDGLDADFLLSVDSNVISGKLKSPDLLKTDVGDQARLEGKLLIDAKKFDLVEVLVPDVQELNAAINADFKVGGNLEQPEVNGEGEFNITHLLIPVAGLELTDTTVDILAGNKELKLNGKFNTPEGSMVLDGKAVLDSSQNLPARFSFKSDNFRLVNLPEIQVFLTSDLLLEKNKELVTLSGDITIPKADVLLRDLPHGSQTASPDVVIIQEIEEEDEKAPMQMKLKVTLGNDVHFAGLGVNAFIDGQLSITAEPEEQVMGSGAFNIKQGSYRAYGQDLDIETGVISFPGGPLSQPGVNLRATRTVGNIVAGISAIGPASKPRLTTFSTPSMSESQVISYLLTGSAPSDAGSGTKLSVGRQINNKLSVVVGTDVKTGESEFVARYRLNRKIHVQTTTAANSNAADLFYTVELGGEDEEDKEDKEDKEDENL